MMQLLTRRRLILSSAALMLSSAGPSVVFAQGTLSTQGFGYPPGELSTRALATGGGLAEFDPQTALNPASISTSSDALLFVQYDPEFRRVTANGTTEKTTTARFPLAVASLPLGRRITMGFSVATLLDRSWETTTTSERPVAGDVASVTEIVKSIGAINDVRLAMSWVPNEFLQVGVGGHVMTGQNRLLFTQTFPDSLHFVPVNQASNLAYSGFAVSGGAIIHPSSVIALGFSGRKGFDLHAQVGDTTLKTAKVPDRYGAAVSFTGIPGATFSAHVSRDMWSKMTGLGSEQAKGVDSWDYGGGVEATGPRLLERVMLIRLGAQYRQLPFLAANSEVRELAFAGGVGIQFARNRAALDVTLQHASRTPSADIQGSDIKERAFTLSFGLRVRP